MNYPFRCPKCNHEEIIEMKMSEYTGSGHLCPLCNEEMQRDISSMTCAMFKDNTGTFYKGTTF